MPRLGAPPSSVGDTWSSAEGDGGGGDREEDRTNARAGEGTPEEDRTDARAGEGEPMEVDSPEGGDAADAERRAWLAEMQARDAQEEPSASARGEPSVPAVSKAARERDERADRRASEREAHFVGAVGASSVEHGEESGEVAGASSVEHGQRSDAIDGETRASGDGTGVPHGTLFPPVTPPRMDGSDAAEDAAGLHGVKSLTAEEMHAARYELEQWEGEIALAQTFADQERAVISQERTRMEQELSERHAQLEAWQAQLLMQQEDQARQQLAQWQTEQQRKEVQQEEKTGCWGDWQRSQDPAPSLPETSNTAAKTGVSTEEAPRREVEPPPSPQEDRGPANAFLPPVGTPTRQRRSPSPEVRPASMAPTLRYHQQQGEHAAAQASVPPSYGPWRGGSTAPVSGDQQKDNLVLKALELLNDKIEGGAAHRTSQPKAAEIYLGKQTVAAVAPEARARFRSDSMLQLMRYRDAFAEALGAWSPALWLAQPCTLPTFWECVDDNFEKWRATARHQRGGLDWSFEKLGGLDPEVVTFFHRVKPLWFEKLPGKDKQRLTEYQNAKNYTSPVVALCHLHIWLRMQYDIGDDADRRQLAKYVHESFPVRYDAVTWNRWRYLANTLLRLQHVTLAQTAAGLSRWANGFNDFVKREGGEVAGLRWLLVWGESTLDAWTKDEAKIQALMDWMEGWMPMTSSLAPSHKNDPPPHKPDPKKPPPHTPDPQKQLPQPPPGGPKQPPRVCFFDGRCSRPGCKLVHIKGQRLDLPYPPVPKGLGKGQQGAYPQPYAPPAPPTQVKQEPHAAVTETPKGGRKEQGKGQGKGKGKDGLPKAKPQCRYFILGTCKKDKQCDLQHVDSVKEAHRTQKKAGTLPLCRSRSDANGGVCPFGDLCLMSHSDGHATFSEEAVGAGHQARRTGGAGQGGRSTATVTWLADNCANTLTCPSDSPYLVAEEEEGQIQGVGGAVRMSRAIIQDPLSGVLQIGFCGPGATHTYPLHGFEVAGYASYDRDSVRIQIRGSQRQHVLPIENGLPRMVTRPGWTKGSALVHAEYAVDGRVVLRQPRMPVPTAMSAAAPADAPLVTKAQLQNVLPAVLRGLAPKLTVARAPEYDVGVSDGDIRLILEMAETRAKRVAELSASQQSPTAACASVSAPGEGDQYGPWSAEVVEKYEQCKKQGCEIAPAVLHDLGQQLQFLKIGKQLGCQCCAGKAPKNARDAVAHLRSGRHRDCASAFLLGGGSPTETAQTEPAVHAAFQRKRRPADVVSMPHECTHIPPSDECQACSLLRPRGPTARGSAWSGVDAAHAAGFEYLAADVLVCWPPGVGLQGEKTTATAVFAFYAKDGGGPTYWIEPLVSREAHHLVDALHRARLAFGVAEAVTLLHHDRESGLFRTALLASYARSTSLTVKWGVPNESNTNAIAEAAARVCKEGGAAVLLASGLGDEWHQFAARTWAYNHAAMRGFDFFPGYGNTTPRVHWTGRAGVLAVTLQRSPATLVRGTIVVFMTYDSDSSGSVIVLWGEPGDRRLAVVLERHVTWAQGNAFRRVVRGLTTVADVPAVVQLAQGADDGADADYDDENEGGVVAGEGGAGGGEIAREPLRASARVARMDLFAVLSDLDMFDGEWCGAMFASFHAMSGAATNLEAFRAGAADARFRGGLREVRDALTAGGAAGIVSTTGFWEALRTMGRALWAGQPVRGATWLAAKRFCEKVVLMRRGRTAHPRLDGGSSDEMVVEVVSFDGGGQPAQAQEAEDVPGLWVPDDDDELGEGWADDPPDADEAGDDEPLFAAHVTRNLTREEKHTKQAMIAREAEMSKMRVVPSVRIAEDGQGSAWCQTPVEETSLPENALVYRVMGLEQVKNAEQGAEKQSYKARLVVLGDKPRDRQGRIVQITGRNYSPVAKLESARVCYAAALVDAVGGGVVAKKTEEGAVELQSPLWPPKQLDFASFYLQESLSDDQVYVDLGAIAHMLSGEERVRHASCARPRYRVMRAMYGLPQAGKDAILGLSAHIQAVLPEYHRASADQALHIRPGPWVSDTQRAEPAFLVTYSDDLLVSGQQEQRSEVEDGLKKKYVLTEDDGSRFIGLVPGKLEDLGGGLYSVRFGHSGHIEHIKEAFEKNSSWEMLDAETPLEDDLVCGDEDEDAVRPISLAEHSALAAILWRYRCDRYEAGYATSRLSSCVHKWTPRANVALRKLIGYLYATRKEGLCMLVHRDSKFAEMKLLLHCDASLREPRSQGGYVLLLTDKYGSRIPISWRSFRHQLGTHSAMAAETVSLHAAVLDCLCWTESLGLVDKTLYVACDNSASIGRGVDAKPSAGVEWLSRALGLRLGSLADLVQQCQLWLSHVCSENNLSDLLTKPGTFDPALNGTTECTRLYQTSPPRSMACQ